jgi:hypothetical protein
LHYSIISREGQGGGRGGGRVGAGWGRVIGTAKERSSSAVSGSETLHFALFVKVLTFLQWEGN